MSNQRQLWTSVEDKLLQKVVGQLSQPICWKQVARVLKQKYNLEGRSSKRCHERWHNNLDPNFDNSNWTLKEQKLLIEKQDQLGNRWTKICKYFQNRNQNFLKNHFYSVFRRALRRANKQIYIFKTNNVRPIPIAIVLKILSMSEMRFEDKKQTKEQVVLTACKLKAILLEFLNSCENQKDNEQRVQRFIKTITEFRKLLKKQKSQPKKQQVQQNIQIIKTTTTVKHQELQQKVQQQQNNNPISLIYSQTFSDKSLGRSTNTLTSSIPLFIPQVCFPAPPPLNAVASLSPIVEIKQEFIEQNVSFPMLPFYQQFTNGVFTTFSPAPVSLNDPMIPYQNFLNNTQGLQNSFLLYLSSLSNIHKQRFQGFL